MYRVKMSREDRAKQFAPFAALKGYDEALRAREKIMVPKIELSEYMKDELDQLLHQIKKNDIVQVVFFNGEGYEKFTGMVARLDADARLLIVVNKRIEFSDLYRIEIVKSTQQG